MSPPPVILVTGFEPFGGHRTNPTAALARGLAGRMIGGCRIETAILPVRHARAAARVRQLLAVHDPVAVLHLGLAEGRTRLALERVALNVLDFAIPDNAGRRPRGRPCVPDGPTAYPSTLPLTPLVAALTAAGLPAYVSNTAGTYLCNQTLYATLHEVARHHRRARAGFLHVPLLPEMVATAGLDQPSMAIETMRRGVEVCLAVIAAHAAPKPRRAGQDGPARPGRTRRGSRPRRAGAGGGGGGN